MSSRALKAWICAEMSWTEEEYDRQRLDFVNDIIALKAAQAKTREDEYRRQVNKKQWH